MSDALVRMLRWPGMLMHSDPLATDRALWLAKWLKVAHDAHQVRRGIDAGCGNGVFTIYTARRTGAAIVGLSDSERELTSATRRARILGVDNAQFEIQDLRELDAREDLAGLDLILCFEVIEHVLDDTALLAGLAGRLSHGGHLLLTSPTLDHAPLYGEVAHLSGVEDGRHVRWGYSAQRLRELMIQCELEIVTIAPIGGVLSRFCTSTMWRIQQYHGGAGWVLTLPLRALRLIDTPFSRLIGKPSHCWGVVARQGGNVVGADAAGRLEGPRSSVH